MDLQTRNMFDEQLEVVLRELPQQVKDFMNDVPLVVEDYPSREIMRSTRVRNRSSLCGLYTGIPLTKRSINHSGVPSDVIHIYRLGVMSQARGADGRLDAARLQKQIRLTILHEYGHHVGLSERDLRQLGYG
jgi:predicted Zn-dependent protease with MMP-like domain